jgi:hypothetical protein
MRVATAGKKLCIAIADVLDILEPMGPKERKRVKKFTQATGRLEKALEKEDEKKP